MAQTIIENEPAIRLGCFLAVLAVMAAWEHAAPRRRRGFPRTRRWPSNLALVVLNGLLARLVSPIAVVALGELAAARGWGLLNQMEAPIWLALPLGMLLLDMAIYWQHRLFHAAPALWRLHRMHHADLDFDVTTAGRFHPLEILLSLAIKLAVVIALGPPAVAVLLFEILLNAGALFNHANVAIPKAIDRRLRLLVVTPDMHRVHHSIRRDETDSNFGFNFPWWDRLFASYRARPADGHEAMVIGIEAFRDAAELRLDRLLSQPFRKAG